MDKTEAQPEALRLADERPYSIDDDLYAWSQSAEQVIRDQHAEIQQLKAQLSARQAVSYSVLKGEVGMGLFKQLLNDYRQCLLQGDYSDAVAAKLALIAEYKQAASLHLSGSR